MCGIFGIVTKDGSIPRGTMQNAVRALAHRGPDDSGIAIIDAVDGARQVGFAHTRLAIIDLSPQGHQPMQDAQTGNWIVFNGEIYNFRDLRAELEAAGNRFHSQSDTEVILAAYRTWGMGAFERLRGMFSFAIWDASRQALLLARDAMGIKPLYIYESEKCFLFASEVRALLRTGLVPRKIDSNGLFSFLAFGSVYEPRTIIEGVSAVPAGQVVSIANGKISSREYWNAVLKTGGRAESEFGSDTLRSSGNRNEGDNLRALLRAGALSHLVSDVPVGVFLSGGIDSSALVALMHSSGVRPSTFSLAFEEAEFNESKYSNLVARRFNTDHHELVVSQKDALSAIPDALCAMDQPTIDGINTFLISAQARAAGVKVALTGLGADEMFAGYSTFRDVPRLERLSARFTKLPSLIRRPLAASMAAGAGASDRLRKISEMTSNLTDHGTAEAHPYFVARNLFTASERQALYGHESEIAEDELAAQLEPSVSAAGDLDPVNRVSYLESRWYMRNTLLRDSDFMSMAHGLELRVPFLDRDLVEACFKTPGEAKMRNGQPKPLLLRSLGVELPREIVNRPKRGFTLPFERWLRGEMRPMVENAFEKENVAQSYVDATAAKAVWGRFLAGQTSWSRPWSLFVLHRWCQQNL